MQSATKEENKPKSELTNPYYMFKFSIRSEVTRKYYERRIKRFFWLYRIEYSLDKEQISYDDLLDALRPSLKGYNISELNNCG